MLDYVALFMLFFTGAVLFYGIIAIHDIPYEIAKKRDHPHQDAIHHAGWVSLFTLHAIWPFLWIWATVYRPNRGFGFASASSDDADVQHLKQSIDDLKARLAAVESTVEQKD